MNSALKPVLTSPTSQNPPMTSQLNKPMHSQNTPATYGQPSTHMPPGLVNLPHNNPNVAHSHPNPAHQANHYSLNVPNAPQSYSTNTSAIPPSNHPITSQSAGQAYANKNSAFVGAYQPNLGHPPNVNPLPPVSQNLPASQPPVHPIEASSPEKPQSNGTTEAASPSKADQQNHLPVPIPAPVPALTELSPQPAQPPSPKVSEKELESKAATVESAQESIKTVEEKETTPNVDVSVLDSQEVTAELSLEENKSDKINERSEGDLKEVIEKPLEKKEEEVEKPQEPETNQEEEKEDNEVEEEEEKTQEAPSEEIEKSIEIEQPKATPVSKATSRTPARKSKTPKSEGDSPKILKGDSKASTILKSPSLTGKSKRTRIRTQPYQSPLPEIEIITKISSSVPRSKANDDKLIVFYKNEFLAVRNSDNNFFVCQALQNIYRTSPKIKIRWLSQEKSEKSGEVYTPDFYDFTDFDCILTNLNLTRIDKARYILPSAEKERTDSILQRSLAVEKGEVTSPSLTEEHPDGIDVSLYKEESQLKKRKGTKRKASSALRPTTTDTKTPEKSKVRKIVKKSTPAATKKAITKRTPPASATKIRRPPPTPPTPPTPTETKKVVTSSNTRTDRAKRRSDGQINTKVSPVVDQKKAKVLAKVARKGALNVSGKSSTATTSSTSTTTKNTKAAKAVPTSPKVQNKTTKSAAVSPAIVPRKTKRLRK